MIEYRMFLFGNNEHLTPWITVFDGKGYFCNEIVFEFKYQGNEILSVTANSNSAFCICIHILSLF